MANIEEIPYFSIPGLNQEAASKLEVFQILDLYAAPAMVWR